MRLTRVQPDLAEPESTSSIFMLKFFIIWSLLKGVKIVIHPSLALLAKKCQLASLLTDPHMMTLAGDDRRQYSIYTKERSGQKFLRFLPERPSRSFVRSRRSGTAPQSLKGTRVKNELKLMDPQRE